MLLIFFFYFYYKNQFPEEFGREVSTVHPHFVNYV